MDTCLGMVNQEWLDSIVHSKLLVDRLLTANQNVLMVICYPGIGTENN